MYPDSHPIYKKIMKAYHSLLMKEWEIFGHNRLPVKMAPHDIIQPLHKTNRLFYEKERKLYRLCHALTRMGEPLDKKGYYQYKFIAQKYGWPYIKETYDNLPD